MMPPRDPNPHGLNPRRRRKLLKLLRWFEMCACARYDKGAADPADWADIDKQYRAARAELLDYVSSGELLVDAEPREVMGDG